MTTEFGYPRRQYSGCRQIDLVLKEGHSDQSPCLACHEIRWQRECAGRNASERRASLEKDNAQADPMGFSGKADTAGVNERSSTPSRCAGLIEFAPGDGLLKKLNRRLDSRSFSYSHSASRSPPALRQRPWRIGSAWLAQEAEGCCYRSCLTKTPD